MATTRKAAATGNPDEAATKATAKKAAAPAAPEVDEVSYQLAIDWVLRRNYDGAGRPFAAKQIERDGALPRGAKDILLGRLDLMQ